MVAHRTISSVINSTSTLLGRDNENAFCTAQTLIDLPSSDWSSDSMPSRMLRYPVLLHAVPLSGAFLVALALVVRLCGESDKS